MVTATVLNASCMEADAYATALMVMGPDAAIDFATQQQLAAVVTFVSDDDGLCERTTPALDADALRSAGSEVILALHI